MVCFNPRPQAERTDDSIKVHRLPTPFAALQTMKLKAVKLALHPSVLFASIGRPTRQQQGVLKLPGIDPFSLNVPSKQQLRLASNPFRASSMVLVKCRGCVST